MMKNNCRWHGGKARNVMFTVFDNIVLHAGHETNVRLMEEVPEGVTKCGCVSWKVQFFVITGKQKLNIPNQCSHVLPTAGWECVFPGSAVITCLRLLVFYRARFSWQFSIWDDGWLMIMTKTLLTSTDFWREVSLRRFQQLSELVFGMGLVPVFKISHHTFHSM